MNLSTESTTPTIPATTSKRIDLEIKEAQLIFGSIWAELEAELRREYLRFPKEIILLGGAPGADKGTNTAFIAKVRGLTCRPIVMSTLLDSPEAKTLKDAGNMVGDRDVVGLLLRELLRPEYQDGVILDGFPRTRVQVECLKLLVDKMQALRREFSTSPLSIHFRQPTIHIMLLFVGEKESVARQLNRGRETRALVEAVERSGKGEMPEDRPTDHDESLAKRRYRVFKEQTWDALQSLKEIYHYHFINAQGPIAEVEQSILHELEYPLDDSRSDVTEGETKSWLNGAWHQVAGKWCRMFHRRYHQRHSLGDSRTKVCCACCGRKFIRQRCVIYAFG